MAIGQTIPQKYNAVTVGKGTVTVTNITANTVVKAVGGRVAKVSVVVAGSTPSYVNNSATIGGIAGSNLVAVIAATAGVYDIDMPCSNGIAITVGTGATLAVSYS